MERQDLQGQRNVDAWRTIWQSMETKEDILDAQGALPYISQVNHCRVKHSSNFTLSQQKLRLFRFPMSMSSSDLSELSSPLSTDEEIDAPISRSTLDFYLKGKNGTSAASSSPPARKKRSPSPPHEYVLADNPDIAVSAMISFSYIPSCHTRQFEKRHSDQRDTQFICMFRSRFSDAFPKSLPHYGPQDIENGVLEPIAGEQVDRLLCALLGLVLNRKKDIECVPLNVYYTWQSRCLPIQILAERKANQLCGADRKGHYTRALEEAIQMNAAQWPLAWQGKNPLHGGGNFTKMTPEERVRSELIL